MNNEKYLKYAFQYIVNNYSKTGLDEMYGKKPFVFFDLDAFADLFM